MTRDYRTRRCTGCNINWPRYDDADNERDEFEHCPICLKFTTRSSWEPTFSWTDALSEKRQHDFEHYYVKREKEDMLLMRRVEPFAFAQYLMDSAEEEIERQSGPRVLD